MTPHLSRCRGRKIYEAPRYMTVSQAAEQLVEVVTRWREEEQDKENCPARKETQSKKQRKSITHTCNETNFFLCNSKMFYFYIISMYYMNSLESIKQHI